MKWLRLAKGSLSFFFFFFFFSFFLLFLLFIYLLCFFFGFILSADRESGFSLMFESSGAQLFHMPWYAITTAWDFRPRAPRDWYANRN